MSHERRVFISNGTAGLLVFLYHNWHSKYSFSELDKKRFFGNATGLSESLSWCCDHGLVLKTGNKAKKTGCFYEILPKAISFVEWLEKLKI